jgi:pimeloyl-ACP methyl ester carboxylesterase
MNSERHGRQNISSEFSSNSQNSSSDLLTGNLVRLRREVQLQVCHQVGKKPAMVFLHGGLGNRYNWRSQYEFFAARKQEVLVYDLAGHGQSTPYANYSLGRHRRDLKRLLQHYQIKNPIICCHSYGVPLGLEWGRKHRAKGLVLIAGGTHDLDPWWEIPLMKFLAWGGRHLYHLPGVQALTNRFVSSHKGEKIKTFQQESPIPTEVHPYQALEIFWGYNFYQRHGGKPKFDLPVLVVSGGQDPTFTYEMGEELTKCFLQGKHLHLPTAGHSVVAEYPDIVNNAIANWLNQLNL